MWDWTSFLSGLAAGALAIVAAGRFRRGRRDLVAPPPLPRAAAELPHEIRALALRLRAEGRTIEAIKLVRERTGLDLKAAKQTVEDLR